MAVRLPRCADRVVAVLAVALAGAAFLPVDPELPAERIDFMLADAQPSYVIDDIGSDGDCAELPAGHAASQAAYVIYTSGSTGVPKGVVVENRGLASLAATQVDRLELGPGSRVLQFSSPGFDASVFELLMAFASGGTLVVASAGPLVGEALERVLADERITHAVIPPAALATLPAGAFPHLRSLIGGRRGVPGRAGEAVGAGQEHGERVRADRDDRLRERQRSPVRRPGPGDRLPGPEHARACAGRRPASGTRRHAGRAVHRRCRAGSWLSEPARPDRRAVRGRPVRPAGGAAVPHRRPGALVGRRRAGVSAAAPTTRSRSAASGSNSARSRRSWPGTRP